MTVTDHPSAELPRAAVSRTRHLLAALGGLDERGLLEPSKLPDWDRLTIVCHLRYGARALQDMTTATLSGDPASYYPHGRQEQRPATLRPGPGESPTDVVASLEQESSELHRRWAALTDQQWQIPIAEPEDREDLGPLQLAQLLLLRLTEVEVHGSDLDLGLDGWSPVFVDAALAFRLEWLNRRRPNPAKVDHQIQGSWLLVATDGPCYHVTVSGTDVSSVVAGRDAPADATIEASSRDLLALLLGRPLLDVPTYRGDEHHARSFNSAFPGP